MTGNPLFDMQPLHARRSALMGSFVETCNREMKHLTNDKLIFDCGKTEDIQHLGLLIALLSEGVNLSSTADSLEGGSRIMHE